MLLEDDATLLSVACDPTVTAEILNINNTKCLNGHTKNAIQSRFL